MAEQQVTKRGDVFDTLQAIDRGGLTNELRDAMREATLASVSTMRKSKIVLEIVLDPDTKTEAMRVTGAVKTVLPSAPKRAALFFPTPDGDLSRMDVRGGQRDIEEFTGPPARREVVDAATGEVLAEGGGSLAESV